MWQKNIPPLPPAWTVDKFMLLLQNSDPTICMLQQKSRFIKAGYVFPVFNCLVLVSLCPLQPQLPVLGWNPKGCFTVVAQPPQGSTCCAFWDGFLLTTIIHNYPSYSSLSVSSPLSDHSPLTHPSTELPQVFHSVLSKLERSLCMKIPGYQQLRK